MTLKEFTNTKKLSYLDLKLIDKLKQFSSDDEYIIGVLLDVYYDEDKQTLLKYINNGENVSYESILLYALELGMNRDNFTGAE